MSMALTGTMTVSPVSPDQAAAQHLHQLQGAPRLAPQPSATTARSASPPTTRVLVRITAEWRSFTASAGQWWRESGSGDHARLAEIERLPAGLDEAPNEVVTEVPSTGEDEA